MGGFPILSLLYIVLGARIIWQIIQNWPSVWDKRFTMQDRMLVNQASFFLLIPISVALHELGHAIAIWAYGRDVLDFGFYGFAGWVAYNPTGMSDFQTTIVSAAGTVVNLILCLIALALVFLKKPPLRAAFNELLLQFAILSGANAFIFYPVLDLLSRLNGDWRQMYDSGVPWLTAIIVLVQLGAIYGGWWIVTNPAMKRRIARLVSMPPGYERGPLGGVNPADVPAMEIQTPDLAVRDAVNRVRQGWSTHIDMQAQSHDTGTAHVLMWNRDGQPHVVGVRRQSTGGTDIVRIDMGPGGQPVGSPIVMQRWQATPSADELTLALRVAMEQAERTTN